MAQEIKKILVWGDSIFKGVALDETGRYRVLPENCGALFGAAHPVELINHSRFGCTVHKAEATARADLAKYPDAQYAVIELGGNDCDFDWSQVELAPESEHEPNTPLPEFRAAMQRMIEAARAAGVIPVLTTLPPIEPNRFFASISRGRSAERLLQWLGSAFSTYRWQESYSDAVADLARKHRVPLLDIRSAFLTDRHYERLICADGMHPNAGGHRLIAHTLDTLLRDPTALAVGE